MPAYNAATTIEESVDSIFAGNFEPGDELIIVNDGSTDSTEGVILKLQEKYKDGLRYLRNGQNKGCPATRNIGIRSAQNDLIFNLDADNVLAPGSIALLKSALVQEKADMAAFANYHYFIQSTKLVTHYWYCRPGWFKLEDLFAGHINPGPGGNFLYTKASWERIGGYWEYGKGLHEAWGFTLKQLAAGSKLLVVPNTFYFHRHGHESLFVSESRNKPGEAELLAKMVTPYKASFSRVDWEYIQQTPNWYHTLDTKPLAFLGKIGQNGKLKLTLYGRYMSLKRKVVNLTKKT